MRRAAVVAALAVVTHVSVAVPAAGAQEPTPTVTLRADPSTFEFPGTTTLKGRISPPSEDQVVQILDHEGRIRAEALTNAEGRYKTKLSPRSNATLTSQWGPAISEPVKVRVRAVVATHLEDVRLFGKAHAHGRVRPTHRGARVTLVLLRAGHVVARHRVGLRDGQWFSTRFRIKKPGTYRARVRFDDEDHAPGLDFSTFRSTPLPALAQGASGDYVLLLERRLRALHYFLRGVDRRYDHRTSDAVRAFNKVQRRDRVGSVSESTWRALADPRRAHPRSKTKGFHWEVDQTRQVLLGVTDGKVTSIIHASTGAGGATRDGVFHVFRKVNGYSGNRLYYPSYFDGLRALHGWPEVPTYPASHGCVRLPMWTARPVYDRTPIGTEVRVYH
ncbi:MAG: L,D-transpeptidase [Actinomycetota bacterium]